MGATRAFFAECHDSRHSTKVPSLSSVTEHTRQNLHHCYLSLWWWIFFAKYQMTLDKGFAECPIKSTQQRSCCRYIVRRDLFVESHTWQRLFWEFFGLCRVPKALDKAAVSSSVNKTVHTSGTCLWENRIKNYWSTVGWASKGLEDVIARLQPGSACILVILIII
jgi:hypothetical protein